ncbi:MAG: amino acid adenylation domain-containing protein [Legionellaceae bacterium]|nr:amino acid adenylation domain-containing protein [Legionellaceae bacterium]
MKKKSLITDWNNTLQAYPKDRSLLDLIEEQVLKSKGKTAFYYQDQAFSFNKINKLSNQLAHHIKQSLSGTDNYIVVYLDRKIESIICLLAILKSNNIYVPIDIDAPTKLITQIIDDCQASAMITEQPLRSELNQAIKNINPQIINIEEQKKLLQQMPEHNLGHDIRSHLAYVLYTSGTTGKPKGVQVSQTALINLLFAMQKEVEFKSSDVLLAITPLTFDISAVEIYLPLLCGASVIFADNKTRYDPHQLIENISKYNVTIMQATPVTWQILINVGWQNKHKIKMVCGGEGLSTWLANKLFATKAPFWNFYGPTETTIWSSGHKITKIDQTRAYIPIGKPLANTQMYILDKNLEPLPIDTPGELFIGGDGVADGYLNNPELSNAKFIDLQSLSTRVYRTGDVAVLSSDGQLHYVGRIDTQIKIRGHRIETEAIENILMDHKNIQECVVLGKNLEGNTELVAFIVLKNNLINLKNIQDFLKIHLPEYMIPTKFVAMDKFPFTSSGKVDRNAIPNQPNLKYLIDEVANQSTTQNNYEQTITNLIKQVIKQENISPESNFFDLGMHSMLLVNLADSLNKVLNKTISVVDLFDNPTIRTLTNFLISNQTLNEQGSSYKPHYEQYMPDVNYESSLEKFIAVIGMASKFPGSDNTNEFWQSIINKEESISFFTKAQLNDAGINQDLINNQDYVPARGILSDVDKFDAAFFGYTPYEASLMDPQHKVFLEQAWTALEDAGYVAETFPGSIGVFAGMNDSSYLQNNILKNKKVQADFDLQQIMLATSPHYLATKVSYTMGLTGPSLSVNTACSTGLVSIAMASENLKNFSCDMALAGAINIVTPQKSGYLYREMGIFSPSGHCNVFDKGAEGTVLSNGCGVVVLKRLSDALKDNDNILAVIRGWATNNDGSAKAGFTAPSINGQVRCIDKAITSANILPTDIEYIETHGTGTLLGDPIEISALTKGYQYDVYKRANYCAIGSVKSNIGHTDTASGIAGFIKATIALDKKTLPPNINFTETSPQIDFTKTPYFVNTTTQPWQTKHKLRTAAVHSLGFGGTNAHVIIQEAPEIQSSKSKSANVLILSAKTSSSLSNLTAKIHDYLLTIRNIDNNEHIIADSTYTLQIGRKHFNWRMAIPYSNIDQLITILGCEKQISLHISPPKEQTIKQIIFGFTGQGSQYTNMAYDLYREHQLFKEIVDECCEKIKDDLQLDLRDILFTNKQNQYDNNKQIRQTKYSQPTLFIIEYALTKLLSSFGIKPTAMIGHSVGEYVAATIAGVFSLNDALKLIVARAKLMDLTKPGTMLAVPMSREAIIPLLTKTVDLAVHNAPNLCVIAGPKQDINKLELILNEKLKESGLSCQHLHTSHAFHSQAMDDILSEFLEVTTKIKCNLPSTPYISNLTGRWITESDLKDKKYWLKHLRNTVLFSDGVQQLNLSKDDIFIEVGPGITLNQVIKQQIKQPAILMHTLPHSGNYQHNSSETFMSTIGKLWQSGIEISWSSLYTNEIRKRISLPTYAFDKKTHWISAGNKSNLSKSSNFKKNALYCPTWERKEKLPFNQKEDPATITSWLLFDDDLVFVPKLNSTHESVYTISSGPTFRQTSEFTFTINPKNKDDYLKLLTTINLPFDKVTILHTWLDNSINRELNNEQVLAKGPYCLLFLAQAFSEAYPNKSIHGLILTNEIYNVFGIESVNPYKSAILGPCKVIPQEYSNICLKLIDIEKGSTYCPILINRILSEANTVSHADFKREIAYRGNYQWERKLLDCTDNLQINTDNRLKKAGVYIITGGLGGIGLSLAKYLAKNYQANLILITRKNILAQNKWQDYLKNDENKKNEDYSKINKLLSIKNTASSLTIFESEIEDGAKLNLTIQSVKSRFGHINGVIHAAGVPGRGVAQLKTIEEYERVLSPKLYGTENLIDSLKSEPLDFIIFMSSITAITGFPGQIDYCSANRILDAYIDAPSRFKYPVFCQTMNWQAWRDVGMAANSKTLLIELNETNSTDPEDGCFLFEKIINSNNNQVIISNEDLNLYTANQLNAVTKSKNIKQEIIDEDNCQSHITKTLLDLWRDILGISQISLDDDFYELGGHSLLAISLLSKIRSRFAINIPSTILFKVRTIRALTKVIQSYKEEIDDNSPLVVLQQGNNSKSPLFLVHPVGGTVFCYLSLVNSLATDRTIYAFQDPSIEHEKPLFETIEKQATFYRTIIQKMQPSGPYYLCGASFGASVVTEIAAQLLQYKEQVNFLGLIDGWGVLGNTKFDSNYIQEILNQHLPKSETSEKSIENQGLWERLLQHRLNMMSKYKHKKINAKISLFKATTILPEYENIDAADNHWSTFSSLPINIFNIPGDHNTMLENPNSNQLAKDIQRCLEEA